MRTLRKSPNNPTALLENHYWYFQRPQQVFGPGAPIPPGPPDPDFEVAEQVATVFDNIIHNDTVAPNQVVVTKL